MMIETDRSKSRKERTFVGAQCAACELSLEHKLSGEKVLQFSCGHVAHEACLYEYIKDEEDLFCPECDAPLALDSARGGNILDLNKLSSMVRSLPTQLGGMPPAQPSFNLTKTWDGSTLVEENSSQHLDSSVKHDPISMGKEQIENLATDQTSSKQPGDDSDSQPPDHGTSDHRLHDFDLSEMESKLKHMDLAKNIPRPKVTIRSEFPTLSRSSQQQSLTCLVTVEIPATQKRLQQIGGQHPLSTRLLSTESPQVLEAISADLKARVENWHGLDVDKFGPLRLHANLKVGRDGTNWQKLDCFLFSELLICVREKKASQPSSATGKPRYQLKGSILVKQHLTEVDFTSDDLILTLDLAVSTLPTFRLKFTSREQLDVWRLALLRLDLVAPNLFPAHITQDISDTEDDDSQDRSERPSSVDSSASHGPKTTTTAPTDYTNYTLANTHLGPEVHIPVDFVVVIPLSSSIQGLKIRLLKDALRFLITHLGERDRMGLVAYGSSSGAMPLVGMATKDWYGWREVYRSIKPVGQKSLRADPVEGANVAMDLLSQRKDANPISSILLISDSQSNDTESVDFVVQRAHAIKTTIYSFGLGQTHKPENLIELSSRTNAAYTYVKDWMMLRECVAGIFGSLQSLSHIGARLKLKIPEGSVAKFVKVSGALHTTKKTSGREAEAILGDLRFGDKRDVLVQLSIEPDSSLNGDGPHDHWETIVTGLATLGGSLDDNEQRPQSVEEVPLLQADLSYGEFARAGAVAHLSHPSLLTITMLPENPKAKRSSRGSIIPPIPSHPSIVQRRMEMLASDMLARALTLVAKGKHDSAHRLLSETRTILQGLGKGTLPPLPPGAPKKGHSRSSSTSKERYSSPKGSTAPRNSRPASPKLPHLPQLSQLPALPQLPPPPTSHPTSQLPNRPLPTYPSSQPSSGRSSPRIEERKSNQSLPPNFITPVPRSAATIDPKVLHALNTDIESCIEFIKHPAVFSHDARKAALQTIGVVSSQRGYTFRTETESFWAGRIRGVKRMGDITRDWRMVGNDVLTEEL